MKELLFFLSGAAVGAGVCALVLKKHYEEKAESEMEAYRKHYEENEEQENESEDCSVSEPESTESINESPFTTEAINSRTACLQMTKDLGYAPKDWNGVDENDSEQMPHYITRQEYEDGHREYDKVIVNRYYNCCTVWDGQCELIMDPNEQGEMADLECGTDKPGAELFIRNPLIWKDFYVEIIPTTYYEDEEEDPYE